MKRTPKNFYTEFMSMKSIRDLIRMTDYITDRYDKHTNHNSDNHKTIVFDTQEIIDKKLRNIINISNFHTLRIKLNRKGGKPSSPATSIMISLPEIIGNKKISIDDMKKFHNLMIFDTVSKLNEVYNLKLTNNERDILMKKYIISSIHYKDGNPHLNIILPSILQTYKPTIKDNKKIRVKSAVVKIRLGLKKFAYQTKLLAEKNMLKLGYSLSDYVIKKARTNKKQNPISSIKQDIKEERQKQLQITNDLETKNNQAILEIQQLQSLFQEMDFLKETSQKLEKRINIYLNRMATALEENDNKKYSKNENLVNSSYSKIVELVDSDENLEKLSKFEKLKKSIEDKKLNKFSSTNYPAPKR